MNVTFHRVFPLVGGGVIHLAIVDGHAAYAVEHNLVRQDWVRWTGRLPFVIDSE